MNVKEIVAAWLKENGYSGLQTDTGYACGCEISDLIPCGWDAVSNCSPDYKVNCSCEEAMTGKTCTLTFDLPRGTLQKMVSLALYSISTARMEGDDRPDEARVVQAMKRALERC